jgi:predicted ATPase
MQLAVLFRLAVEAGSAVSYRAISEDIWGMDAPENTKAALQSIVSRLRSQLPPGVIESTAGGYRLLVARDEVDALAFSDRVAAAANASDPAREASDALAGWGGEPWIPSENFDWFVKDLMRDHARAIELGGVAQRASTSDLPAQLTSLVGREAELDTIRAQLAANRLVTIIGTGGAGKTRLAVEAASRHRHSVLVELAPAGPSEVQGAVLAATGREIRMADAGAEVVSTRDRILDALAGRDVLLVLDNCEHVIDAAAALADELLQALPQLKILSTSREPLGVPGEAFVGLGSLPHPSEAQVESLAQDELANFAAIELFCQRATSARGTAITEDELPAAARICSRLDGLPLAIELAAAKLRTMSVDEVLRGLDDRFTLLTGSYRTGRPRHQTLKAMVDWSWSLLEPDEQRALTWFAVFPAGVGAAEAAQLASTLGLPTASVFDSLVDRSLLQRSRGRFRALETIREYGIDRLTDSGELVAARTAQASFMVDRAHEFDQALRGPRIMSGIAWFDAEEDNLAAALRFTTGANLRELAVRLTVSSAWYWLIRDRNEDANAWLTLVAPLAEGVEGDEAKILNLISPLITAFAGQTSENYGPPQIISEALRDLMAPYLDLAPQRGSNDLLQVATIALRTFAREGNAPDWIRTLRLPAADEFDVDPWPAAMLSLARCAISQNRGEMTNLGVESLEALAQFEKLGDLWGIALSEQMHSLWLAANGKLEEAIAMGDSSTEHMRAITTSWDLTQQQGLAVQMLIRLGRMDEARSRVAAMVAVADADGNPRVVLQAQLTAVLLDIADGDAASAGNRVTIIDGLRNSWDRGDRDTQPPQIIPLIEIAKSGVARLRNDLAASEAHLRIAADSAVRSQDQPVVGQVALAIASHVLARGDVALAVRAVDVSTSLTGAFDATALEVIAIVAAADTAGIERPSTQVPERPMAIESLSGLL